MSQRRSRLPEDAGLVATELAWKPKLTPLIGVHQRQRHSSGSHPAPGEHVRNWVNYVIKAYLNEQAASLARARDIPHNY